MAEKHFLKTISNEQNFKKEDLELVLGWCQRTEYYFKETSNGIEVTQEFKLKSGVVDAFFMWLFGAKAGMEKTNEQGLELLKKR